MVGRVRPAPVAEYDEDGDYVGPGSSSGSGPAPAAVTYTNASIVSATGASQSLLASNTARKALLIVNIALTDWVIDPMGGTAAAGTPPGFTLYPGDSWAPSPVPTNAMTGIGTAASKLVVLVG